MIGHKCVSANSFTTANGLCFPLAEFNKIVLQTALGFVVMGFIGFFVKLVFIVRP